MNSVEIITKSRREFINLAHILAHAIGLEGGDRLVIDIIGGRNVKKSLAVDAFLQAFEHEGGVFRVPVADKMMFENAPSQADGQLVEGVVKAKDAGVDVSVGFTRNMWEQMDFHAQAPSPSILIIPKKNKQSLSAIKISDIQIYLDDMSMGLEPFHHKWKIDFMSETLSGREKVRDFLKRMNVVSEKRPFRQFPVMTP